MEAETWPCFPEAAYTPPVNKSSQLFALQDFLKSHPRLMVLTGAGVSQASGIPTYRDKQGVWRHSDPIKHQEYIANPDIRRRYWARSLQGWPMVRDAQPNNAHRALASLEHAGFVDTLVTQNVDRLHQRAGSRKVIDLHGRLDRVRCLDCGRISCRQQLQDELGTTGTPIEGSDRPVRPDGDMEVPDAASQSVNLPHCKHCGGVVMPDVVFFGGTVPRDRVNHCLAALDAADALLVVGSSLQVYSGFRFCRKATETGKPLAIINPGATRADEMADLKLPGDCGELLQTIASRLTHSSVHGSPS